MQAGSTGPAGAPQARRIRRANRIGRSVTVFLGLAPFVMAFLRDRRRWLLFGAPARRSREDHQRRADRLTSTVASLGPTFIKLVQLFSARADIFPEPYLSSIGRLQDQVPADPLQDIIRVVEQELGIPVDAAFQEFDRTPVAAASLGQVHRARLDGREVVVKVLRPGVEQLVALDLDVSFRILFWLNVLFPNHHVRALTGVVREFSHKAEILRTTGREPIAVARNLLDEAQTTLRSLRDLVTRAEREELRVRMHPRDLAVHERFLHRLENPLHHVRGIRPHERER